MSFGIGLQGQIAHLDNVECFVEQNLILPELHPTLFFPLRSPVVLCEDLEEQGSDLEADVSRECVRHGWTTSICLRDAGRRGERRLSGRTRWSNMSAEYVNVIV